jgi:S-adenosylmethionine/arginine decarboxylase-like enzyme
MSVPSGGAVVHLVAELTGIASAHLHDAALLGGLLIAAAGAAGLHVTAPPVLRSSPLRGVDALLLLEGGHATLHAEAHRETLLLDVLVPEPCQLARALEVFTRRLAPVAVAAERLIRMEAVR